MEAGGPAHSGDASGGGGGARGHMRPRIPTASMGGTAIPDGASSSGASPYLTSAAHSGMSPASSVASHPSSVSALGLGLELLPGPMSSSNAPAAGSHPWQGGHTLADLLLSDDALPSVPAGPAPPGSRGNRAGAPSIGSVSSLTSGAGGSTAGMSLAGDGSSSLMLGGEGLAGAAGALLRASSAPAAAPGGGGGGGSLRLGAGNGAADIQLGLSSLLPGLATSAAAARGAGGMRQPHSTSWDLTEGGGGASEASGGVALSGGESVVSTLSADDSGTAGEESPEMRAARARMALGLFSPPAAAAGGAHAAGGYNPSAAVAVAAAAAAAAAAPPGSTPLPPLPGMSHADTLAAAMALSPFGAGMPMPMPGMHPGANPFAALPGGAPGMPGMGMPGMGMPGAPFGYGGDPTALMAMAAAALSRMYPQAWAGMGGGAPPGHNPYMPYGSMPMPGGMVGMSPPPPPGGGLPGGMPGGLPRGGAAPPPPPPGSAPYGAYLGGMHPPPSRM